MKDVTHELSQMQRGLLFYNSSHGIMIGGHCGEGEIYHRCFSSNQMTDPAYPEEIFYRTGEIMEDDHGNYCIVYKTKDLIVSKSKTA